MLPSLQLKESCNMSFFPAYWGYVPYNYLFFFSVLDFIKVGDDPGAGKGKTGDNTKM